MTSRERVVAALRHKEPDRIPLDLGATESSSLTAIACNRLRSHLGLGQGRTRIYDVYQQVALLEDDMRVAIPTDFVTLTAEPKEWKLALLADGSPCEIPAGWNPVVDENGDEVVRNDAGIVVAKRPAGTFYFDGMHTPLAGVSAISDLDKFSDDIESFDWPAFLDEGMESLGARGRKLYAETDLAVVGQLLVHFLAAGQILRGYETFMMDMLINKPLAHALLERLLEAYMKRTDRYLAEVGDSIQVVLVNDDLGTQHGPMLSIDTYKEMIWPYQKRLYSFIKSKTDAFILLHSCGSVARFIPHLIEAGVDALNPVQVSAAEMDTAALKREYGRDITFWGGGCDTQRVLPNGSPDDVKAEVRRRIRDLAPGGGFIFTQVHNIQPDVPPENVMAMIEAVAEGS
jgi:uroporphyrinogen decarboxylase